MISRRHGHNRQINVLTIKSAPTYVNDSLEIVGKILNSTAKRDLSRLDYFLSNEVGHAEGKPSSTIDWADFHAYVHRQKIVDGVRLEEI